MKFGSWRLMPGPPNVTTVCGTSSGMKARCGGLAASTSATGVRLALAGNPPKVWSSNLPSVAASTSPTTAIRKRILGQHAADIVLQVGDVDFGNALQRAAGRPAIGMVAKGDFQELAAGKRGRAGGVAPQAGHDLGANALDIGAVEMRRCQRHPQQVEGFVLVVLEHAQRAAEIIPRRTEAQLDGAAIETLVKGLGIEIARAFVEQIGDHVADAGLVGGILRRAAAEGIFHRDQRHGGVLHEPGLDAAGRNQTLDLGRGVRRGRGQRRQRDAGGQDETDAPRAELAERLVGSAGIIHERFSSRFGVVSLTR